MLGTLYPTNPRLELTPNDLDMVRLWRLFQGGMGPGHLPDAGGVLDQPALMLDAFAYMNAVEAQLQAPQDRKD